MSTHNIPFSKQKRNHPRLSQINSYGTFFSKGLTNVFERAVVNEPSAFEPLKVDCTRNQTVNVESREKKTGL